MSLEAAAVQAGEALDPITLEVLRHGVIAVADQIEANVTRTAFSLPIGPVWPRLPARSAHRRLRAWPP